MSSENGDVVEFLPTALTFPANIRISDVWFNASCVFTFAVTAQWAYVFVVFIFNFL